MLDNCAMWLNGFNNNVPGYPMKECQLVRCPDPYMGSAQPGAPPDPSQPAQGPFGTGELKDHKYALRMLAIKLVTHLMLCVTRWIFYCISWKLPCGC